MYNSDSFIQQTEGVIEMNLTSPLPQIVYDADDVKNLIRGLKLIPKFQTVDKTSLSLLQLIRRVCDGSTTHGGCLNAIQRLAFDGLLDIQYNVRPAFVSTHKEVNDSDRLNFEKTADDIGLNFQQIQNVTKLADKNYIESGDGYIYCKIQKILGIWRVSFSAIHYTDLMFFAEGDKDAANNPVTAVWAKSWENKQIASKKYRLINVTQIGAIVPNFSDHHDEKIFETVFHVKNGDDTDLYGELTSRKILRALFNENQKDEFQIKADATETVAKHIFATPAPPNGVDKDVLRANREREAFAFRQLTTPKGTNPQSIIRHSFYAQDGSPHLFNLDVFRDIDWFLGTDDRNRRKIQIFHGINEDIYGAAQTKTGFSADAIIYSLKKADESVIRPRQNDWSNRWSYIFNIIGNLTGHEILKMTTLKFEQRVSMMLQEIENLRYDKKPRNKK